MGKRYHCDYCDKSMVATPAMVKTHNQGLVHQKLVQEHYQQFKDPEKILQEEATKKPCSRFARGQCQFGAICRFSHYSAEELNKIREFGESFFLYHSNTKKPTSIRQRQISLHFNFKKQVKSTSIVALRKNVNSDKLPLSLEDLYQKLQDEKRKPHTSSIENQNTVLCDSNGLTHVLPWRYNAVLESYGDNLPPSLKRLRMEDFQYAEVTEWGG